MLQDKFSPNYQFVKEVDKDQVLQTEACFQCRKCTSGCPVTFAMDLYPDEVVRFVLLGHRRKVLACKTIWVCAGCETCTTRCPNEVKIAELMDRLKEMVIKEHAPCLQPQVKALHQTFLDNLKKYGRVFESSLLPQYLLRSGQLGRKLKDGSLLADIKLGWKMLRKGRMPLFPKGSHAKKEMDKLIPNTESE